MNTRKLYQKRLAACARLVRREMFDDVFKARPSCLEITTQRSLIDYDKPTHLLSLKPGERP